MSPSLYCTHPHLSGNTSVSLNELGERYKRHVIVMPVLYSSWILMHHHPIHPFYPVPPCLSTFTALCFALLFSLFTETFLIVPVVWDLDRRFSYVTGPLLCAAPVPLFPSLLVFPPSCLHFFMHWGFNCLEMRVVFPPGLSV